MRRNKKVMMGCLAAALILLMAGLGVLVLADTTPEYTASASTNLGENISLRLVPVQGLPSAWTMAWRVGTTPVSTVNIGIQVQPTGANVVNPRLTYYIKAVCGTNSKHILRGTNVGVTLGSVFSNSTGSMSIDSHLQSLGVSTSQDQTVTYYIYARLEAQGAVSGQTLVAEVQEQVFSTVLYDYGGIVTIARSYVAVADSYVKSTTPNTNYGVESVRMENDTNGICLVYVKFNVVDSGNVTSAYLLCTPTSFTISSGAYRDIRIGTASSSWTETGITWNNKPSVTWRKYYNFGSDYPAWINVSINNPTIPNNLTYVLGTTYADTKIVYLASREQSDYFKPTLYLTIQTINWALSWAWANQPLSLIAVPVARLMVTLSLLCFAGLILYAAGRGSKISLAAALAFVLLAVLLGLGVAYAAETVNPMPVPEKWQAGETAIYLQSFPFPAFEYINGTAVEKPAEVVGDLMLSLAVFNATENMPVLIKIDGQDTWQLCGEGFYSLQCSLSPGMHSLVVYCPIKIFEETVFYVKPKPVTPLMPLEEFMKRLEQQRNEIVTRSLVAAAAGVPVGYYIKRKIIKIRTGWVSPLPCAMMVVGYWKMPDLYMLLFAGATLFITYYLPFDFARRLVLARFKANNIDFDLKLPVDEDGEVIVGISPRNWRHGFIRKKRLEIVETLHDVLGSSLTTMTFDGRTYDCIILDPLMEKPVEHYPDRIVVYGKPTLRAALLDSQVLEKVAEALKKALLENRVAKDLIDEMAEMGAIDLKSTLQSPLRQMLENKIAEFTTVMVKNVEKPEVNGENENQT